MSFAKKVDPPVGMILLARFELFSADSPIFTYFWNFQCYRITAKMDIAYTARLDEKDVVVHRRNMTVGVGCGCKAMRIRRFMQVRALHIDDEK